MKRLRRLWQLAAWLEWLASGRGREPQFPCTIEEANRGAARLAAAFERWSVAVRNRQG